MALVRDSPYPSAGWGFPPAHGPAGLICPFNCHPCAAASRVFLSSDVSWGGIDLAWFYTATRDTSASEPLMKILFVVNGN